MNDPIESELRAAFASRLETVSAEREARLCAFDYRSRATRRRRLWAALGASGSVLTGGIVAAILLLSSGASVAYAGWTPVPTTPSPTALAAATAACNWAHSAEGAPVMAGTPVLTDQRGKFTAAIYVVGIKVYDCLSDGSNNGGTMLGMNEAQLNFYSRPGPDQLGLPDNSGGSLKGFLGGDPDQPLPPQWQQLLNSHALKNDPTARARLESEFRRLLSRGMERNAFGLAGGDVSAVTFVFADGTTVDATVQNGWYFAWWPNDNYPSSVRVVTTSGSLTSPMMPAGGAGPGCNFGADGCVWAGLQPQPPAGAPTTAPSTTVTTTTTVSTAP